MIVLQSHIVPEGLEPKRFSDYAREVFTCIPSAKGIKKAIKRGELLLDGKPGKTGDWMQAGQRIDLVESEDRIPGKPFNYPLDIVFEDEELAVIHKPAGLVVSGNLFQTVENAAFHQIKRSVREDALAFPRPVHRLDRSTSGLLLFAKTRSSRMELGRQFERKEVFKTYHAVACGETDEAGSWDAPIEGKSALTLFKRLKTVPSLRNGKLSLVELHPQTGRTHQLRIHLSGAGFPILGDSLYGKKGHILKGRGLFLAAVGLRFIHPVLKEEVGFELPAPAKFESFMHRALKRWESQKGQEDFD